MPDKYIIQSLQDGLKILYFLMQHLKLNEYYSIKEIQNHLKFDYQKTYRILFTLNDAGFIEEKEGRYRIGNDLLLLSHNYMLSLKKQHDQIKDAINSFMEGK